MNEKVQKIIDGSKIIGLDLPIEKAEKLDVFMQFVLEYNQITNLTSITDIDEFITKHILDSYTIAKYVRPDSTLIDIGTGAGFPGIPLKILYDDIKVTLADATRKKTVFIEKAVDILKLTDVTVLTARAEDIGQSELRASFDFATARAVSSLSVLIEYCLPLLKIGGELIAMKGSNAEEITNSKNALKELGGEIAGEIKLLLPNSDMERNIIIIKKTKDTQMKYPRRSGIPAKNPL